MQPPREARRACPDLETIAALVEGTLRGTERTRATEHLAACETCYFVFAESAQRRSTSDQSVVKPFSKRHSLSLVAVVAAAASFVFFIPNLPSLWGRSVPGGDLQALVDAVGTQRSIEPRLTGGFSYGRLPAAARNEGSPHLNHSPDVIIAAATIEKRATDLTTPDGHGSLAVAYLVMGQFDKAVPVLEELVDRATPSAAVLSDLSAAYMVRAASKRHAQDFARALTFADRAVKADVSLAEGWFNRALALEHLSLSDQARTAWEEYLKVDPASGWSAEAKSHLTILGAAAQVPTLEDEKGMVESASRRAGAEDILEAVRRWPHATREWSEEQLLVTWPHFIQEGRSQEANALLTRVAAVAEVLEKERGDAFIKDSLIAASSAPLESQVTRVLAEAHRTYRAALTEYQEDRIAQAAKKFHETLAPLEQASSPFAVSARFYRSIASYYAADYDGALTELESLKAVATARRYTRLIGLIHRVRGLIHVVQGRFGLGLDEYRAALERFAEVADHENETGIHGSLAENLEYVGERQAAWSERYAGLSSLHFVHDPRRRHTILQGAAVASMRQDLPETALYFQHAALSNATAWGRPPAVVNVLVNRAEVYTQLDQTALAQADLARAQEMLAKIEDRGLVARSEARILLARGQTLLRTKAAQAVESLGKALSFFEEGGSNFLLARVYLARGRGHLATGHDDLAEADFLAGINNFERMRSALTSDALRSSYFEQPWDVFTELIRLEAIRRNRPERALVVAEQARARTLLETISSATWRPLDPAAIRQSLPEGVTILYYASLDERLLTWALSRTRLDFVDVPTGRRDLVRMLDRYREQGATGSGRDNRSLIALYDALIRPIEKTLSPGTHLAVVPDGVLHTVPFAALVRSENHRYLVEDYPISITPSLSVFQLSSRRVKLSATDSSALIVGNPRSQSGLAGANLPGAQAEARDIAGLYRNADLLVGSEATKDRFLSAIGKHRVVHFAGHAIPNEEYPGLSRLMLTSETGSAETVFAHEISTIRFEHTELVVLAACRTNSGQIRRGEGVLGLARPFIAAGVPTVVASLTDVDDRASHPLFVAFHRAWRRGQSATDAMRSAQLEALSQSDVSLQHPVNWGSLTVIGGSVAIGASELLGKQSGVVSAIP